MSWCGLNGVENGHNGCLSRLPFRMMAWASTPHGRRGHRGPSEGHFGLQGVRERLRAYGGNLSLESTVGHGTRCVVTLRLKKEEAE